MSGLATRLYKGQADLNIVAKRKIWFTVAAVAVRPARRTRSRAL